MDKPNLEKSLAMQEKGARLIPGMTQLLSKRPDMFSRGLWPGYFSKSEGAYIWDLDGNKYLDMSIGGIGANVLGYCDEDVNAAVIDAVKRGNSSSLNCPEEVELAELLVELHPWASKVRYARTGGEAMAVAVRIARAFTGKDTVAFCGYHGWHDWYLAANVGTENALGEHLIAGLKPTGVPKALKDTAFPFRYNQLNELEEIVEKHGEDLGVIVMEPIRNFEPTEEFIKGVRAIADKTGAVLIVDEISAGFRFNTGGAHLVLGIDPDIAVFSKGLGNGYPIAAIIGKENVMEAAQISFISSTYWTERVGFAAAIATIKKHRAKNVGKYITEIGRTIAEGWKNIGAKYNIDIHVGGIPQMGHFSFELGELSRAAKVFFIQEMLKKGFLASTLCYMMYSHTLKNIKDYLKAFDEVFSMIRTAIDDGTLEDKISSELPTSGFQRLS